MLPQGVEMTEKENRACRSCGKDEPGVEFFGKLYRAKELKAGREDPGILCGECAGSRDGTRIGEELFGRPA